MDPPGEFGLKKDRLSRECERGISEGTAEM